MILRAGGRKAAVLAILVCASACAELPSENGEAAARVELGRHLFYDVRLSINEKRSCGLCHEQAKGFTDGFVRAVGATEEVHPRNTLSLANVADRTSLGWLEASPDTLREQLLVPLLGTLPVEMGMGGNEDLLVERLEAAGAVVATAPSLGSSPNPPGGAGWSWGRCGCQKGPLSDQIPTLPSSALQWY